MFFFVSPSRICCARQAVLLLLSVVATWLIKPGSSYASDDPELDARNRDSLHSLANERSAWGGNGAGFAANYGKIRGKMSKKYGKFLKEAGMGRF